MIKLGQEVVYWNNDGHTFTGRVQSKPRTICGSVCVLIDNVWMDVEYISIDGEIPENRKVVRGRMHLSTGGIFGTWNLDNGIYGISDWTTRKLYTDTVRYYRTGKYENKSPAVVVSSRQKTYYTWRCFDHHGNFYQEGKTQSINAAGQNACDALRELLVDQMHRKYKEAG